VRWTASGAAFLLLAAALPAAADDRPLICFGNEPSWSVDLTQRGVARFSMPDQGSAEFWGDFTRIEPLHEAVWRGRPAQGSGADLVVFLRDGDCSDGMSDTVYPVSARASLPGGRFLVGCCRVPVAAGAMSGSAAASPAATGLEGPVWRLESLAGQDASALANAQPPLSVRFHAGRVEGFSGCNRFAGGYKLESSRIKLGPLAGTMMACGEPAMSLENAFRSLLSGGLTYAIVDGRLTLTSDSGAAAGLREAPAPSLGGVTWEVTGYNNGRQAVVSPKLGTTLSFTFADGNVSGRAGCNTFRAPYTVDGNRVAIGPAMTTRKHCPEEGVMEQEREFLAALEAAKIWTVRDDLLDMHFADGETRALTARPQ